MIKPLLICSSFVNSASNSVINRILCKKLFIYFLKNHLLNDDLEMASINSIDLFKAIQRIRGTLGPFWLQFLKTIFLF